MTIYQDLNAYDILETSWGGAADRVKDLTIEQIDIILDNLEEIYPEGMGRTELNDFFWFEEDTWLEWLGYESPEHFQKAIDNPGKEIYKDKNTGDYMTLSEIRGNWELFKDDEAMEDLETFDDYMDYIRWDIEEVKGA